MIRPHKCADLFCALSEGCFALSCRGPFVESLYHRWSMTWNLFNGISDYRQAGDSFLYIIAAACPAPHILPRLDQRSPNLYLA